MRWFWILILAVSVVAIVVLARPRENESGDETGVTARSESAAITQRIVMPPEAPPSIAPLPAETSSDRRLEIAGSGSPADPYRVTWALMQSAHDTKAPNGEVRIPNDLALIDGTVVEISGYLAPPVQQDVTNELLVMQKRWDGCCIGIPPTPFDCIEVRLERPVTMRGRHLIQYGTIRGILRIEPFTAGKFLLGLYRIEHGIVEGQVGE